MTTVVAMQTTTGARIACDSQATDGDERIFHQTKVVQNGPFLLGGAGDCSFLDLMHYIWKPPVLTTKDKLDLHKFMVTKVVPSIRALLEENKQFKELDFDFIFIIQGKIFNMGLDLSVLVSRNGISAVGTGGSYALGAIMAGATLENAMQYASEIDSKTSGPFDYFEQRK